MCNVPGIWNTYFCKIASNVAILLHWAGGKLGGRGRGQSYLGHLGLNGKLVGELGQAGRHVGQDDQDGKMTKWDGKWCKMTEIAIMTKLTNSFVKT